MRKIIAPMIINRMATDLASDTIFSTIFISLGGTSSPKIVLMRLSRAPGLKAAKPMKSDRKPVRTPRVFTSIR